jgi:glucose-1-phosphate adenylyltransferase
VLVLDGGAIYRMDYAELIRAHQDSGAQITLAVRGVADPGCGSQPRVVLDAECAVVAIEPPEPPAVGHAMAFDDAPPAPDADALSTMGVYCFDKGWLLGALDEALDPDTADTEIALDRIAPLLGGTTRVCGYRFGEPRGRVTPDRYWCNLDSIDTYYQANMALLKAEPPIDLYQADWNIRTYQGQFPPARTVPGATTGTEGIFVNSMLAAGAVITGGGVNHSILYPRVRVGDEAIVDASILFDGVSVGEGAQLRNCIIEKDVRIPAKTQIGLDGAADRERFEVSDGGIVVVAKGHPF